MHLLIVVHLFQQLTISVEILKFTVRLSLLLFAIFPSLSEPLPISSLAFHFLLIISSRMCLDYSVLLHLTMLLSLFVSLFCLMSCVFSSLQNVRTVREPKEAI